VLLEDLRRRHRSKGSAALRRFLRDEKELAPRTVHNKFAELLTLLAAQGVPKLISKNDRPRFVDQEVEIYEDPQFLALHSACSLDHSTQCDFYLMSGFREQEACTSNGKISTSTRTSSRCAGNPRGILLIASNPVDVMTYTAWKWSELPANRVIGSGTSLDTARFRRRLAEKLGVASGNVHAYILGEHGECQVPVVSSARIAGIPLAEFCNEMGLPYDAGALGAIADETRKAGAGIIRAKGATYYRIGAALVRIVCAILRDEHSVFTVSSLVPEFLHLGSVFLSLPIILSREGVHRVLPTSMNSSERHAFEACAETQKQHVSLLDGLTNS
jgi:malate/lactate dehydrogenase